MPPDPVLVVQRTAPDDSAVARMDGLDQDILNDTQKKYQSESEKRRRPDGINQYIGLSTTSTHAQQPNNPQIGNHALLHEPNHHVLIVGAGYGGLLFAVRLLQSGFCSASEITLVDEAGGFGGTWYWNRYPGLMCDVESYIYMPLLEETKYMPTQKYVSGTELREHANRIANQWNLTQRALLNTSVSELAWNDKDKHWTVQISLNSAPEKSMALQANFVILATGLLNSPKIPKLPGIDNFHGRISHTSRWDYEYTGGTEENPEMKKLTDKRVGIVGTGASGVQIIPQLARWAKELVVFQRTPSAVDCRNNSPTDPDWWAKEVQAYGRGWQKQRMENFNAFISNESPLPDRNLVNDAWTRMQSYSALVGGPAGLQPDYLAQMHQLDFYRQEAIRRRIDKAVSDPATAQALKPWYSGWCKRPCFSDEFLQAFNQPNVTLVDTMGRGIQRLTTNGVVAEDTEFELDAILFSTGYSLGSSADCGKMKIVGRGGFTLQQKWQAGLATLHGVATRDFPNLFFPGPYQAAASGNQLYVLDQLATHVAYMLSESVKSTGGDKSHTSVKVMIEPSSAAEEEWTMQVLMRAPALAGVAGCTPSYFNQEGRQIGESEQLTAARFSIWGEGIRSYVRVIEDWRKTGQLEGLEIHIQ